MKGTRLNIAFQVLVKWISLIANLVLMTVLTIFMEELYVGHAHKAEFVRTVLIALGVLAVRFVCHLLEAKLSFKTVSVMKRRFRNEIYQKLLRLGASYKEQIPRAVYCKMRWKVWTDWKFTTEPCCRICFMAF